MGVVARRGSFAHSGNSGQSIIGSGQPSFVLHISAADDMRLLTRINRLASDSTVLVPVPVLIPVPL
jgi:hypothetical protein